MFAERIRDGHLGVAVTLRQQVEGQHLRVVVVMADLRGGGRLGGQRPEPALTIGERDAGQQLEPGGQRAVAQSPVGTHVARGA